jgi:hypothetical protein
VRDDGILHAAGNLEVTDALRLAGIPVVGKKTEFVISRQLIVPAGDRRPFSYRTTGKSGKRSTFLEITAFGDDGHLKSNYR